VRSNHLSYRPGTLTGWLRADATPTGQIDNGNDWIDRRQRIDAARSILVDRATGTIILVVVDVVLVIELLEEVRFIVVEIIVIVIVVVDVLVVIVVIKIVVVLVVLLVEIVVVVKIDVVFIAEEFVFVITEGDERHGAIGLERAGPTGRATGLHRRIPGPRPEQLLHERNLQKSDGTMAAINTPEAGVGPTIRERACP